MKLNSKNSALVIALFSIFGVVTTAYAERNEHGYGHSATSVRLYANPTGAVGQGQGQIEYTVGSRGNSIEAGITLPVNGTTLVDSNAAVAANVTLLFPKANVTCNLLVEDVYLKYPKSPSTAAPTESADYQLFFTSVPGATNNLGSCYTTGTTTPAAPVVASGDEVDVILNGNPTPVLVGTFK